MDISDIEARDPVALFKEYFQKRGIDDEVIDLNEIQLRTFESLKGLVPPLTALKNRAGVAAYIPYFDQAGNPIPYHTARILELSTRATFSGQLGLESAKLVCPPGVTHAYFPRNNPPINKNVRCVVTESAVKAIVAAMCGFYAIGLNGCWGFRSKHTVDRMLPDFRSIPWRAFKDVVFVPDSNVVGNADVSAAAARFCSDLFLLHKVQPRLIVLPKDTRHDPAEDWGIDDYLAYHGRDALTEILSGEGEDPELSEYLEAMVELNKEVSYIREADLFAVHAPNILIKEKHFHTLYATRTYLDPDDRVREATRAWIRWPLRREVAGVINRPGAPESDGQFYNLWRPAEIDPFQGDMTVHEKFMQNAFPNLTERRWIQQWIGHVVQKQDVKLNTALVLYSPEQGTGKTMLAEAISFMLGEKNTARTTMDVFKSSFNSSYAGKQLVVINETLAGHQGDVIMDKLKVLITEHTIAYHAKGQNSYEMPNYANYILTTNHTAALKIDPTDRRFAILELKSQFRHSKEAEAWGEECWQWHRDHLSELLWYYQHVDIEDFSPSAPAIETEAKKEMAEAGYTELELSAKKLLDPMERADYLKELGLKEDTRYVFLGHLIPRIVPGILRNPQGSVSRLGAAFKKFGKESEQYRVQTPDGVVIRRMYCLDGGPRDADKATQDYLFSVAGKHT